jgi:hypothetical protein
MVDISPTSGLWTLDAGLDAHDASLRGTVAGHRAMDAPVITPGRALHHYTLGLREWARGTCQIGNDVIGNRRCRVPTRRER